MASRFSPQMSGQMPGCPAAMRVMSRNPPAARRSSARCSSLRSSASRMSVAAVRWGTWDTTATSASWRSGGRATTSAPERADDLADRGVSALASVPSVGVSTHVAPSNSSAAAPSTPSCSEPAIGWPPTKRGSATASTIGAFTLPTSVTTPVVVASARRGLVGHGVHRGGDEGDLGRGIVADGVERPQRQGLVDAHGVGVAAGDVPAVRRRAQADRAADEPGADDDGPARRGGPAEGHQAGRSSRRLPRALEVDVVAARPRAVGTEVDQHPDAQRRAALDVELAGADAAARRRGRTCGRPWPGTPSGCRRWR